MLTWQCTFSIPPNPLFSIYRRVVPLLLLSTFFGSVPSEVEVFLLLLVCSVAIIVWSLGFCFVVFVSVSSHRFVCLLLICLSRYVASGVFF